ncbi:SGNH/GDSL hydrolase family protein [Rhodococcus pyridinivorans]|uniref:SGNH/GDSL hydrolase family protein n=1 Tax=Rhodococcus pyridinivorans TaxID=103816 RepID=UPI002657BC76|nr:SGNH/GDSL hydrolase family protein [Rhodococcus pyridinivorans]
MGKRHRVRTSRSPIRLALNHVPTTSHAAFWAFMVIALIVASGLYWALSVRADDNDSTYVSQYTPAPALPDPRPAERLPLPNEPRLLVIGDSWTWGQGVTPHTQGYAYKVGELMGWPVEVNGGRGSGYVTDSMTPDAENPERFPTRVKAMPESLAVPDPNIIIVQGSINDLAQPPQIEAAAFATLRDLKRVFPDASLVVVGPIYPPDVLSSKRAFDVEQALRKAAIYTESAFIDPTQGGRFIPDDQWAAAMGPDSHPNALGHQLIANELSARLKVLFHA